MIKSGKIEESFIIKSWNVKGMNDHKKRRKISSFEGKESLKSGFFF